MPQPARNMTRLLLIGAPGSEFRRAAALAVEAGAEVVAVDSIAAALDIVRADAADLAMIDIKIDIAAFIAQLRREHMSLAVYACGVDAPASHAVAAIRAGARDYLPLPPDRDLIAAAILSVVGKTPSLIGNDPAFDRARSLGLAVAPARAPFLITGEPGSGRELLARTIHAASGRSGRFVVVNCVDVSPEMIDSELFGHQIGTFPEAVANRRGRLDAATDGTLFLAEIALLPTTTQVRLAELLDRQMQADIPLIGRPARVIASTAFDLEARVSEGRFRSQLYNRIGLVRLAVPPLRQRGPDIGLLAHEFGARFAIANGLPVCPFTDDALAALQGYDWPGNVGELADVVHRAILVNHEPIIPAAAIMLADGGRLRRSDRVERSATALPAPLRHGRFDSLVGSTVEDVERALILETLKACSGNRTSASTILGISVRTMRNKLKTFSEAGIAL
jgi:two-component system, NtrC family, response regulator HydG